METIEVKLDQLVCWREVEDAIGLKSQIFPHLYFKKKWIWQGNRLSNFSRNLEQCEMLVKGLTSV